MKKRVSELRPFLRGDYSHFLFITAISFAILLVLSFVLGLIFPHIGTTVMVWFSSMIQESGIVDSNGAFHIWSLLMNNMQAMLLSIFYGVIPFIYFPALSVGTNAMLLGLFASVYWNSGESMLLYLMGILPHGIFEIPAMVLSMACGLYLCSIVTRYVRTNQKGIVSYAIRNIVTLFISVILPLIIIAAVVECYLTPVVMQAIMS